MPKASHKWSANEVGLRLCLVVANLILVTLISAALTFLATPIRIPGDPATNYIVLLPTYGKVATQAASIAVFAFLFTRLLTKSSEIRIAAAISFTTALLLDYNQHNYIYAAIMHPAQTKGFIVVSILIPLITILSASVLVLKPTLLIRKWLKVPA